MYTSSGTELSINNLHEVRAAVFNARAKWYDIGLALEVPVTTLDSINGQFDNHSDKLREMLKVWLKTATKPAWKDILDALKSPVIGEPTLASKIVAKHCTTAETGQASGQRLSKVQLPQQPAVDEQLQNPQQVLQNSRELRIEDQDSQRRIDTLQQELQESQRQNQQLTHQLEEKQHTIDDRETQLRQLNGQLHANEQVTAEIRCKLLHYQQANRQLRRDLRQAEAEKQAREGQLQKLTQRLQTTKLVGAQTITPQLATQPQDTITRPRQELQQAQPVEHAAVGQQRQLQKPKTQQLPVMKRTETPPQKALVQQKTIQDMKWQKESTELETMFRGSAASESNIAYFNGCRSTTVYSYYSDTHEWHQLPDSPHTQSTLVVVQHILTMVGGYLSGKVTNSLLSLMGEGGAIKWLPHFPAMPTARQFTAAVCSGHSLIVAGGVGDGRNSRLVTVEVLDIDTKKWSTACSLPHPFSMATISICHERLYLMGGYDETSRPTHSVLTCSVPELLQCQTQSLAGKLWKKLRTQWRQVADAPHSLSSCATLCGQLVAVGGRKDDKNTAAIFVYKETTNSWEAMGDMPTARCLALVAILNGKLLAVGGGVGGRWLGPATNVVEILC